MKGWHKQQSKRDYAFPSPEYCLLIEHGGTALFGDRLSFDIDIFKNVTELTQFNIQVGSDLPSYLILQVVDLFVSQ
jgi:hypothetical protein